MTLTDPGRTREIGADCAPPRSRQPIHGRSLPEPDQVLGHNTELCLRWRAPDQWRGRTLLPHLQGAGRLWPYLPNHRRRSHRRAGVLQALQCRMAHREKWTTQSAPHTYHLGESQNEASRLTQTCVQRTGCSTPAVPFIGPHDHINDHTATTRGHTGTTQVLVKTGQCHPKDHWSRIYSRSSFCKPLQNTAIRFNLLQSALQENAIFCNGMLRNASFCFAHTRLRSITLINGRL